MPRTFTNIEQMVAGDKGTIANFGQLVKYAIEMLGLASFQKNLVFGGSMITGMPAIATGDVVLYNWFPLLVDNLGNQIADSPDVVRQVRYLLRVSNPAISITPKLWYGPSMDSIPTAATISGEAACSATDEDLSGDDQLQTLTLTLPTGLKYFKPGITIGGTPAPDYFAFALAIYDCYIDA